MLIQNIVERVNQKLAGEILTYDMIEMHLDAVIDDINSKLSSTFPAFSEFTETYAGYPDYKFFPDRYIRSVVIPGAAMKFYATDEEGDDTARLYQYEYKDNMFLMVRDYSDLVPSEFCANEVGYLTGPDETEPISFIDLM